MDSGFFKQRIIDMHASLAEARVKDDQQRMNYLETQIRLCVAALKAIESGPLDSPHPFDGLKLTTDLDDDGPCILGRHRPTPPTA